MSSALIAAIVCTVVLLVVTTYFLMGSVPLLILRHDTALDARFVTGFVKIYFAASGYAALATAFCYAWAGRPAVAAAATSLAAMSAGLHFAVLPKMESLRSAIQAGDPAAIPAFRRWHGATILTNLAQLVVIVTSLIRLSMQLR